MDRFFTKHGYPEKELTEKHALKLIHTKVHEARKAFLEEEDYMKPLAEAHCMIEDLFAIKGLDPETYYKKLLT